MTVEVDAKVPPFIWYGDSLDGFFQMKWHTYAMTYFID